ncbi:PepSY-associated TM helix domain-containing protein [Corallococcus macrosporus]|uniref:PepSY-associated TM helix domain-containing protein n=1 Tax=Myxococcus fulvus (strain ATCC BAA-855 / HW-1) TaxID=483219 RepID=F8CG95_MYXFH|nr:PepSY-associated TM helix domain-containing protein [Corallococcus macrosporus]AEI67447.1 PepSY-associated TM helix domain-containing protein [Corallococcus macrosporus]
MRTFRNILFWIHLLVGVAAGLVIAIMSFTGVVLAFEKQLIAWAERDARTVQVPAPGAPRLPVEELIERVRASRTDGKPSGVTVFPEPTSAVQVSIGRGAVTYVNPYTGEVLGNGATGLRGFFRWNMELHRWLVASGDSRAVGKAITGASNAVFLFLAISGLYLWWPRKWTLRAMRPSLWFRRGLKGKARDWNWHNVIGFWSLPVLIVLTASGMVISYKWASNLVYTVTGNTPPASKGPPGSAAVKVPAPAVETPRKPMDALIAEAQRTSPTWSSVTLRLGGGARGGEGGSDGVDAVTVAVREADGWPLFSSKQVSLNPFTGEVAKVETYADYNSGRKARSWLRFLHTGEALGLLGQLVAAIASLGGVFLVYTGFALSWRRFFTRRRTNTEPRDEAAAQSEAAA